MNDLEYLRELFRDTRLHIGIGTITKLGLSLNSSTLRVHVNLLPENREVWATMGWPDVNDVTFPEVDDLVIVNFVDGEPDECHVTKLLSSDEEPIPTFARTGHSVKYSRTGKKLYLGSDTKISLSRPGQEPSEPLVLGNVLKSALQALANAFLNATEIGETSMGPAVLSPAVRTALTNFVSTYVTTASTNVVSQIGFTERGV